MFYVYILVSEENSSKHYTDVTGDLQQCLDQHNRGECTHTAKLALGESKLPSPSVPNKGRSD